MTTVATWGMAGNALSNLPVGMVLDKWGPRVTSVLGATMFIAGCLLFALCDRNDVTLPVIGFALLGMAGPGLTLPCFQFCELYGNRKASALAYLMTSFEVRTTRPTPHRAKPRHCTPPLRAIPRSSYSY